MEGLFFAIGFLLGGVVGVLIMCLLHDEICFRRRRRRDFKRRLYPR